MVLPLKVCEELLQVIDDSNATLPVSMRCMRSYKVRQFIMFSEAADNKTFDVVTDFSESLCFYVDVLNEQKHASSLQPFK